ncbi:MAG: hypothetical protein JNJ90_03730 [Saprospiraceae bacterium]|nr:hypothetical protein [Saprospiraceae bacterium]
MFQRIMLTLVTACLGTPLCGQFLLPPSHRISVDVLALSRNSLRFEYEFGADTLHGWSFQFEYRKNAAPAGLFNGIFNQYYGQRRTDTIVVWSNQYLNQGVWEYLDENRPLPRLPEYNPVQSWWFGLNYTAHVPLLKRRLAFFAKPGLFYGNHRYYSVEEQLELAGDYIFYDQVQTVPYAIRAATHTVIYRQSRTMTLANVPVYGLMIDAGLRWSPVSRVTVDFRGGVAMNIDPPHNNAAEAMVTPFAFAGSVQIGFTFGKKPLIPQPEPAPQTPDATPATPKS